MPYGTPTLSNQAEYSATFINSVGSEAVFISVKMGQSGEGGMSLSAQDALFQEVIDALAAVASLQIHGSAYRGRSEGTEITPTP